MTQGVRVLRQLVYAFAITFTALSSDCLEATGRPGAPTNDIENQVGRWLQARGILGRPVTSCNRLANKRLSEEILRRYRADQEMRKAGVFDAKLALELGIQNGEFLKGAMAALNGAWPDACLVGLEASDAALILLQHVPDLSFRKEALSGIITSAQRGHLRKAQVPMIVDRIAAEEGKPQSYGTQLICNSNGLLEPAPIENKEAVDERRESFDLPPLKLYVELLNAQQASCNSR